MKTLARTRSKPVVKSYLQELGGIGRGILNVI